MWHHIFRLPPTPWDINRYESPGREKTSGKSSLLGHQDSTIRASSLGFAKGCKFWRPRHQHRPVIMPGAMRKRGTTSRGETGTTATAPAPAQQLRYRGAKLGVFAGLMLSSCGMAGAFNTPWAVRLTPRGAGLPDRHCSGAGGSTRLSAVASAESLGLQIRKDFPTLQESVNGKALIYLDSAATSQKPIQV